MTDSATGQTAQTTVRVRPGCQHPTLGPIGGWEGVVLRSFSVGGVTYCDVALSAKTLAQLSGAERGRCYSGKIVFTRFRVAERDTQPLPGGEAGSGSQDAAARTQREWYAEVGSHQQDPTQFVADRAGSGPSDAGRRQVLRSLVGVAVFMLFVSILVQRDCNNGSQGNGSWGRSGGFSS